IFAGAEQQLIAACVSPPALFVLTGSTGDGFVIPLADFLDSRFRSGGASTASTRPRIFVSMLTSDPYNNCALVHEELVSTHNICQLLKLSRFFASLTL